MLSPMAPELKPCALLGVAAPQSGCEWLALTSSQGTPRGEGALQHSPFCLHVQVFLVQSAKYDVSEQKGCLTGSPQPWPALDAVKSESWVWPLPICLSLKPLGELGWAVG